MHFDYALQIGISCDLSNAGTGVVLFQRYTDGSEWPIANALKMFTDTQLHYSQIQEEALAVIYRLKRRTLEEEFGYRSQTIGCTLQPYKGNACISSKPSCSMGPYTE